MKVEIGPEWQVFEEEGSYDNRQRTELNFHIECTEPGTKNVR